MTDAPVFLAEVETLDPAGNPVTFYWSTRGYTTGPRDTPANRHYAERLNDVGIFSQALYGEGRTIGQSSISSGEIELSNADDVVSVLRGHSIDGRAIRLKRLAGPNAPYSSAVTVLTGRMEAPDAGDAWRYLKIGMYDRLNDLDRPLQVNRYAGTTLTADVTYEGTADAKGNVKPLVFGRVRNIELPVVNPFQWLYQASDSALHEIVTYDGGSPRNPAGDYGSVAAAIGASALYGRFTTCLAQGIVRFVGNASMRPAYVFTADVKEGATLADRYPGAVARRMLRRMGFSDGDMNLATFAALDAAAPYEVGIFIDGEETGLSAISRLLASVGAYIVADAHGRFSVGRLTFATPVMTIDEADIHPDSGFRLAANPDSGNAIPPWRIILQYQQVYRVLEKSSVAGCVDEDFATFLSKEWRELTDADDALLARHPKSPEMRFTTLLDKAADAQAELARNRALYGVNRDVTGFRMKYTEAPALGSTVTLKLAKLGYQAGRDMIVIGRADDFGRDLSTVTLWG